jgi:hypothetical protein
MSRRSRIAFVAALVIAGACGSSPTAPVSGTMSRDSEALFDGSPGDSTCRGGWDNPNGKAC